MSRTTAATHGCAVQKARHFFTSKVYHAVIIALVVLDLASIMTDLGIILVHCEEHNMTEALEQAVEALSWLSIAILAVFLLEFGAQLLLFGKQWLFDWSNCIDLVVVVASFVMELVFKNTALQEVVALIIVFRLWRLIRIVHSTEEILHIEHAEDRKALHDRVAQLQREVDRLKAALQAQAGPLLPPSSTTSSSHLSPL